MVKKQEKHCHFSRYPDRIVIFAEEYCEKVKMEERLLASLRVIYSITYNVNNKKE